jgi:hypothetical protein
MAPIPDFEPSFQIFVRNLEGKTKTYEIKNSDTILELKEKIQKEEGIIPDNQMLLYKGKLEDDKTIGECGIQKRSILHLCVRLRGGMFHTSSGRTDFQPTTLPHLTIKQVQEIEDFDLLTLISRLESELE